MTSILRIGRNTALALSIPLLTVSQSSLALNIALTNDDGWDASGIQTLRGALVAAGHTVTLAGSTENQSGSSAGIDLGGNNLIITKEADDGNPYGGSDQYSVGLVSGGGAEPATAGQIAINIAELYGTPVDLVISGTNAGANIGAFTNLSGTVGAAIHALSYTSGKSIPALAISTDEVIPERNCPEGQETYCAAANHVHFEKVAAWMVDFVAELETKPGWLAFEEGLLPKGIALNINYPTYVISGYDEEGPIYSYVDTIAGVDLNVQGRLPSLGGLPIALPIGCYADCVSAPVGAPIPGGITGQPLIEGVRERRDADTSTVNAGKVSIVPIDVNLTAQFYQRAKFKRLVDQLNGK